MKDIGALPQPRGLLPPASIAGLQGWISTTLGSFATNRGSGSGFTVTGALADGGAI
jgi:hypothetical protein